MAKKRAKKMAEVAGPTITEDKAWRARHAFDTLVDAEKIRSDKSLMREVKKHANKQREAAARIARLEGKQL